jgi:hypothetical protein
MFIDVPSHTILSEVGLKPEAKKFDIDRNFSISYQNP